MRTLAGMSLALVLMLVLPSGPAIADEPSKPPERPAGPGAPAPAVAFPAPPAESELQAITARGRILAEYDEAAWYGTDAFLELHADTSNLGDFIAQKTASGKWRVVFGRRSESDGAFLVAYEAVQGDGPRTYSCSAKVPPLVDRDFLLRASRALATARATFQPAVERSYNLAVLPTASNEWFVYLYPAVLKKGLWPIGGDVRYTIDPEGRHVRATRKLHNAIVEAQPPDGAELKAGVHTHVLACIPEDTDVMAVLRRDFRVPEYVACDPFLYALEPDGRIRYVGLTDEVLGDTDAPSGAPAPPSGK